MFDHVVDDDDDVVVVSAAGRFLLDGESMVREYPESTIPSTASLLELERILGAISAHCARAPHLHS